MGPLLPPNTSISRVNRVCFDRVTADHDGVLSGRDRLLLLVVDTLGKPERAGGSTHRLSILEDAVECLLRHLSRSPVDPGGGTPMGRSYALARIPCCSKHSLRLVTYRKWRSDGQCDTIAYT